jgi:hypothetical protein
MKPLPYHQQLEVKVIGIDRFSESLYNIPMIPLRYHALFSFADS